MRLGSVAGASVDLRLVDYQYPAITGDGAGRDWDANWLVVAGDARTDDGRAWSFQDPCLTTWEGRRLALWLRGVVDGTEAPTPFDGSGDEQLLVFTEPNLAFSLADRSGDGVVIRVHLSLESRAPWLGGNDPDLFDYFLALPTSLVDLVNAADDWDRQLERFPER